MGWVRGKLGDLAHFSFIKSVTANHSVNRTLLCSISEPDSHCIPLQVGTPRRDTVGSRGDLDSLPSIAG